jgi:hypothetical protein
VGTTERRGFTLEDGRHDADLMTVASYFSSVEPGEDSERRRLMYELLHALATGACGCDVSYLRTVRSAIAKATGDEQRRIVKRQLAAFAAGEDVGIGAYLESCHGFIQVQLRAPKIKITDQHRAVVQRVTRCIARKCDDGALAQAIWGVVADLRTAHMELAQHARIDLKTIRLGHLNDLETKRILKRAWRAYETTDADRADAKRWAERAAERVANAILVALGVPAKMLQNKSRASSVAGGKI